MKKLILTFVAIFAITSMASAKSLVVYFSQPDNVSNSYVNIKGEQLGNTQYMAEVIREKTGADIFRIIPTVPYTTDHKELLSVAQKEIRTKARPKFNGKIDNFADYDTVFVGYPIWNADLPYIVYTFFDTYDFSGKTIVAFCTHGGSGFAGTVNNITKLELKAKVIRGMAVDRDDIQNARQDIINWLDKLDLKK